MRVRVCVLFLSHEEKKESESALFVCADFLFRIFFHLLVVWRSLRQKRSETHTRVHKKRKERKESCVVRKKRDFSDDDDEVVYIFLSGNMAQRSPRKSLQLNRANTPINFSGPMQDVNVSSVSFFL